MGEAKRRKQRDSSYGKLDKRLTILYPEDKTSHIYDDPNILVGSSGQVVSSSYKSTSVAAINLFSDLRQQIRKCEKGWIICHGSEKKLSLVLLDKNKLPPITYCTFFDRKYYWQLDSNPTQWSFKPSIPGLKAEEPTPEEWDDTQIINEMRHWPVIQTTHEKSNGFKDLVGRLRGHYQGLSLWQEYRILRRKDLEPVVLNTPLETMLPFADLDTALPLFTDRLWEQQVPMALRANSREHLWYCAAYSLMLKKKFDCGLTSRESGRVENFERPLSREVVRQQDSLQGDRVERRPRTKDLAYNGLTKMITYRKKALRLIEENQKGKQFLGTESDLMLLSFESLQERNWDWREWIVWLLVDEAIKYAWFEDNKNLIHYCRQFLTSYSHYSRITNGKDSEDGSDSSTYAYLYLDQNQQLVTSQQHQST